jgi:hypothetical protein
MNADHKDALVLIARKFAHIESQEATMTAVDRLGFHVRVKTPDGMRCAPRSILASSNSVISPAVLGFLILFNARKVCSLRRRPEFGIFFIFVAGSTALKN